MERRIFLAVILGAVVMYGWQALFMPPPPPPRQTSNPAPSSPQPAAASSADPAPPALAAPEPAVAAVKSEPREREIVVETAVAQVVLTNRGGRVLHWRLKQYRTPSGELVDLIPSSIPAGQSRPFALRVDDQSIDRKSTRLNSSH